MKTRAQNHNSSHADGSGFPYGNKAETLLTFPRLIPLWFFFLALLIPSSLPGQETEQWVFHSEVDGVNVYYQFSGCNEDPDPLDPAGALNVAGDQPPVSSVMLLKLENTNAVQVKVEWLKQLKTPSDESKSSLDISAGETRFSDCTDSPQVQLSAQPDDGYPVSVVEAVDLLNVVVIPY